MHRPYQPRLSQETESPTVEVTDTESGLLCACAVPASPPPPRARAPPPSSLAPRLLALPFPSPAARAEHCGTQTKCPQTGWSEPSGNGGGAGPHARGGGSLPTSPSLPLTPLPLPHPAPPGKREPSPRSPNRCLPSANRPQRPPARGSPGPLAPPLRPPERSPPSASLSRTSQGCRRWGLPCPCRRLSTGLGAAARDRVPSASRGRREAAGRALRPLPPGRRHLAASAWRGGGGGAAGLRPPAPPPAGNREGRARPALPRRPCPRAAPHLGAGRKGTPGLITPIRPGRHPAGSPQRRLSLQGGDWPCAPPSGRFYPDLPGRPSTARACAQHPDPEEAGC